MPTHEETCFTRQQLYDLVWSDSLKALAKQLNISDVMLGKVCRKLNIPLPGVGYWQKVAAGKKVEILRLPNPKDTRTYRFFITRHAPGEEIVESPAPEVPEYVAHERMPENKITVLDTLRCPHPQIAHAIEAFRMVEESLKSHRPYPKIPPWLEMSVSKEVRGRALRIMNALLKALDVRDIPVVIEEEAWKSHTYAVVRNEKVAFGMYEASRQSKKVNTWGTMERVLTPCGELVLRIHGRYSLVAFQMRDGKRPLEDRLNDFIVALYREAEKIKADKAEQERRWIEEEDRRHKAEARRKREEEQAAKVKDLYDLMSSWQKAREVREFLAAVRKAHEPQGGITPDSELGRWMVWATDYANQIDPLIPKVDDRHKA